DETADETDQAQHDQELNQSDARPAQSSSVVWSHYDPAFVRQSTKNSTGTSQPPTRALSRTTRRSAGAPGLVADRSQPTPTDCKCGFPATGEIFSDSPLSLAPVSRSVSGSRSLLRHTTVPWYTSPAPDARGNTRTAGDGSTAAATRPMTATVVGRRPGTWTL